MDNHLKQEFQEYQKEKETVSEIIHKAEGRSNSQHKIIKIIFAVLIIVLLVVGLILRRLTLTQTLAVVTLIAVLKVIWMFYDLQKSIHFEFWLLNSLEFRLNEIDKKIRKVEKLIQDEKEK